ncbi:MAG: hypothetical protein IKV28_05405 [Bacteroidales bacterium]|nr:hypothetical protein [Bacteroidales bacterium]
MNIPQSFTAISAHEACQVVGGRSEQVGKVLEAIAAGLGLICKLVWNLFDSIRKNFYPPEVVVA